MIFAFLFLGLLPVMFFSDVFDSDDTDAETDTVDEVSPEQNVATNGDFLDSIVSGTTDADVSPDETGLQPVDEDDEPVDGDEIDPDDVLDPVDEDEEPVEGDEIDPDDVLDPADDPGDEFAVDGDGSFLQQLLDSESDSDTGIGFLGTQIDETDDLQLSDGDDSHSAEDDGLLGTGLGEISSWDGTPILSAENPVDVISGGAGDDEITLGDDAAYAFGGDGDDVLAAGEGTAALFGGSGADSLTGTDTGSTAWLDGGDGDDVLTGGAADEVLDGGAHDAGDGDVQDDDTIDGGAGDDLIRGGFGADILLGGAGDDVIDHLGRTEEQIVWERHDFDWHIDGDADTLDGGDGNDTLIMDRADTATGGDGMDTFWVYFDAETGAGAAEVTDFSVGEDFLRVTLNPELGMDEPDVSVAPSDDGLDGVVTVNGETVAILRGAPGASVADVYAEVVADIFG